MGRGWKSWVVGAGVGKSRGYQKITSYERKKKKIKKKNKSTMLALFPNRSIYQLSNLDN